MENTAPVVAIDTGGLPQDVFEHLQQVYRIVTVPHSIRIVCSQLESYMAAMRGGVHVDVGAREQRKLYYVFITALSAPTGEYMTCIGTLLYYFNREASNVLGERQLYRFSNQTQLTTIEKQCFSSLINLFCMTAHPAGRAAALKTIDMNRIIAYLPDEQCRQQLLSFYTSRR